MLLWLLAASVSVLPWPTDCNVPPWDPPKLPPNGSEEAMWQGFVTFPSEVKSYRLFTQQLLNWKQAATHCRKWRSHLVIIDDKPEIDNVNYVVRRLSESSSQQSHRKLFHAGYRQINWAPLDVNVIQVLGGYGSILHWKSSVAKSDSLKHPSKDHCLALDYDLAMVPVHCENEYLPFVCERCQAVPPPLDETFD